MGVFLNFRSCAPIQHKKKIVEGTVRRIFRSTSTRQNLDKALTENESIWLKYPNPESWTYITKIYNVALQKIISKPQLKNGVEKVQLRGQKMLAKDIKPLFFLQY